MARLPVIRRARVDGCQSVGGELAKHRDGRALEGALKRASNPDVDGPALHIVAAGQVVPARLTTVLPTQQITSVQVAITPWVPAHLANL